jgi:hypothetical protein
MKVKIMKNKTWEKVSRSTKMENSMIYVSKSLKKGLKVKRPDTPLVERKKEK